MSHPFFDYLRRVLEILRVGLRQIRTALFRRLHHEPVDEPILLREGLEQIGGCFVKFGQILSLQIDSLPREYCDALLHLLDAVPPVGDEAVRLTFEREFHAAPETLFRSFNYSVIGAASIGQVHKAELKDGTPVAVKVQRPGAPRDFQRDIVLLGVMMRFVFLFRIRSLYFMRDPIRELGTWTRDELDYRREAAHCNLLAENAAASAVERIPRVYWELTTSRILTMEFLAGPSVATYLRWVEGRNETELAKLRADGFVPEIYSRNVITNFLSDAFRFGVFHADMHPANILILPNNVVGYVDFGIVATLTPEARRKQIELTQAYATGNADDIYREFLNICTLTSHADLKGMREEIGRLVKKWYEEPAVGGRARFRVSVTVGMVDLMNICRFYGVLVDREMIKYIRSIFLTDGLVNRIAPSIDVAGALRKVVEEYLFEQASRKVFSRAGGLALLADMTIWLKTGPSAMLRALDLFERRELNGRNNPPLSRSENGRTESGLRARVVAMAAVWMVSILFLVLGGGAPSWRTAPFFAAMIAIFMTSWTIWMLLLLRRLLPR